jgi:hypothetical protein
VSEFSPQRFALRVAEPVDECPKLLELILEALLRTEQPAACSRWGLRYH